MAIGVDTTGQLAGDRRNQTKSGSRNLYHILLLIRILLDPVLAYFFVISDDKKCIRLDRSLGIPISILLTIFDIIILISYRGFNVRNHLKKKRMVLLCKGFNVFPFSLVMMILFILPRVAMEIIFGLIVVLLLQFLSRFAIGISWFGSLKASRRAFLFFYSYVFISQMFGGLWYFYALSKNAGCWEKGCRVHKACHFNGYCIDKYYNNTIDGYKFINDYCSTNTTNYDFGIFLDTYKSGILEMTGSALKILYFFRWALQTISTFGQSLDPGFDATGNIVVIIIIYLSVMLFFILVGIMQILLQPVIERNERIRNYLQKAEQWLPFRKLSANIQSKVIKIFRSSNDTKDINVKTIFDKLPNELRQNIVRELCENQFKKVEEFRSWSEKDKESFKKLCDCAKLVFYDEYTNVMREGDLIDKMVFVIEGTLWIWKSTGSTSSNPRDDRLNQDDFCGEELATCFKVDRYTLNLPVSTRSIQAVTNVQAFALMAYDLRKIFIEHHERRPAAQGSEHQHTAQSQQ